MNDYKPTRPAALGAAAVAMTALTIGFAVVLPARVDTTAQVRMIAPQTVSASATEAAAAPLRVEVIAVRDAAWSPADAVPTVPKRKAQGPGQAAKGAVAAPERVGYRGASAPAPCPT